MNTKVLIAVHKPGNFVRQEQYLPIHVGSHDSTYDLPIQRDDEGENISSKNGSYCELTALYWAWKNLKNVDIIGLCHYRRFFNFHDARQWPIESRPVESFEEFDFSIPKSVIKKVQGGAIVVPASWFSADTVASQYCMHHYFTDMNALRDLMARSEDRRYAEAFDVVIDRGISLRPLNMFVMKWSDFNDLCAWLFQLLDRYEKVTDITSYSTQQKRLYGYVAERLLNVWYYANRKQLIEKSVVMFADGRGVGMPRISYLKDAWKCRLSRFIADWRSYKSW